MALVFSHGPTPPAPTLLALIFWGMMWGVIGMFLAVPITVAVKIFLERLGIIDMLKLEPAASAATAAASVGVVTPP